MGVVVMERGERRTGEQRRFAPEIRMVAVTPIPDAVRRYCDKLGFEVVDRNAPGVASPMSENGETIALRGTPPRATLELVVRDVQAAVGAIVRNGGELRSPQLNLAIDHHAICTDVDGNRIEIRQIEPPGPLQ